ncbi:MAG: hypothetical protein Q7V20_14500 [Aquabacterium sp.]|nr:hypothetical protein [Aquabacterium sp.]MDO9004654.1 hypothetical protein [Aquabacterium sp.]
MNCPGLPAPQGHQQGIQNQLGVDAMDHLPGEQIDDVGNPW